MTLQVGVRLGPYEVLRLIGVGGMGEVYRAHDLKLRRDVALKILPVAFADDPDRLARSKREAQILASLNHPHIAAIYGLEESNQMQALVMELVEGPTLADRIADGPLPVEESLKIAAEIADALEAAHEKGIIHRDLKPANIKLTHDNRVKVLDFGLATMLLEDHTAAALSTSSTITVTPSQLGVVVGTTAYMSPEQANGKTLDKRTDIWAFGCVLFELLTGQRAFPGADVNDSLVSVLTREPEWTLLPNATPPRIVELLRRCLEKDPRERLRDIGDARIEILANDRAAVSEVGGPRRRTVVVSAAILFFAALAAAMIIDRRLQGIALEPPIPRRLTFERGEIHAARFAPDGSTVVYSGAWRGGPEELFMTRLDSRESRPLGIPGRVHAVSSTSEIAVDLAPALDHHEGGTIAQVPLAGGAPRQVIDHVRSADWSPDGSELAVVRRAQNTDRIEFPIGQVIYEASGWIDGLRVSPRGDWVAFAHHPSVSDAGSVEVVSRTGEKRVLSSNWADLYGVAWRPDGREIWFTAARSGEFKSLRAVTLNGAERLVTRLLGEVSLYDIGRDGRVLIALENLGFEMRALDPVSNTERDLTWLGLSTLADISSDGRQVLFTVVPEVSGEPVAYIRRTDGTPAVRLGSATALALSPDGNSALCIKSSSTLVLLPTGVGTATTLKQAGLTYHPLWASWFRDGRRIVFAAQLNNGPQRIYVQDTDGGSPVPIGPPGIRGRPVASPDGRTIAVFTDNGPMLFTIDGSDARPFPGLEKDDFPRAWSVDGRMLFFTRERRPTVEIRRVELSTGRQNFVRRLEVQDPAGMRPPGVVRITLDGKYYAYSYERLLADLYLIEGLK